MEKLAKSVYIGKSYRPISAEALQLKNNLLKTLTMPSVAGTLTSKLLDRIELSFS